jgi:hypothetical protein
MKKILIIVLACILFLFSNSYALDTTLRDMRSNIYGESNEIKKMMRKTRDPVLVSSIYDSCLITTSQLDAYFHMLTIFNTIERRNLKQEAVESIANWLNTIKRINTLSIESLKDTSQAIDQNTKIIMSRLKKSYIQLNKQIETELKKVDSIKKSLNTR